MTLLNLLTLYPLQVALNDMWKKQDSSPKETITIVVIFVVIIAAVILLNLLRGKSAGSGPGSVKVRSGFFAKLALHRLAANIGLNSEQIKMLDFAFKTDQVLDPEKSIATPSLLDRHFRRAYRVIEQTSKSNADIQYRHAVLFSTRNLLETRVSGELTSTRQLKDDTSIILNHGKERYEVKLLSAIGENLALECPKNALGSSIKFQKGGNLGVLLFTKNNKGFSFETRVIGYTTVHGKNALLVAHSNKLKFLSQRRFRRRQLVIASNLYLVYVEGSGNNQRLIVDKRRLTGNIADISVGGCSIKIKSPVQVGARMKIEFTQGEHEVAALGQVLRTNRAGVVTIIHIKFLKVSRKSMNIINAFVYEYANE
jgi:c-di-GMP-binding flagellar brake protein YcgR